MIKTFFKNNIKSKNINKKYIRAFTMVESLMAIFILTSAIIGPIALAQQTIKASRIALYRTQAAYLAEEPIEMMLNFERSVQQYCITHNSLSPNHDGNCDDGAFEYFYNLVANPTSSSLLLYCDNTTKICTYQIDKNSFILPMNTDVPNFIPDGDCKYLTNKDSSSNTLIMSECKSTKTNFARTIIISPGDKLAKTSLAPLGTNDKIISLNIKSIVCLDMPDTLNCGENYSGPKVTVLSRIVNSNPNN